ncbi:hypothetical protein ASF73_19075 [Xanthomonas sp. Leaf131]|nr:hypothetical protein ASF73_19075 [Xanthomonas sp. Leaf131]
MDDMYWFRMRVAMARDVRAMCSQQNALQCKRNVSVLVNRSCTIAAASTCKFGPMCDIQRHLMFAARSHVSF